MLIELATLLSLSCFHRKYFHVALQDPIFYVAIPYYATVTTLNFSFDNINLLFLWYYDQKIFRDKLTLLPDLLLFPRPHFGADSL